MKPFISQWSFKLFALTASVPIISLWVNNFNLPKEGTLSMLGLCLGGTATTLYLSMGVTLFIRELCYQHRVRTQKPVEGFEEFYEGYKQLDTQPDNQNLEHNVLQILLQLGYNQNDAKRLIKKALSEKSFNSEQELLSYVITKK